MITVLQAYQATIALFDTVYFRQYIDSLGSFLGDTRLIKDTVDWQNNPCTIDDRMWNNWIVSVEYVLNLPITLNDELTIEQGFIASKHFLFLYASAVKSEELIDLYKKLEKNSENSSFWQLWLLCVEQAKNDQLDFSDDSLIGQSTTVNLKQAVAIIYHFAQNQLSNQNEILQLLKHLLNANNAADSGLDEPARIMLKNSYQIHGFHLDDSVSATSLFKIWTTFIKLCGNLLQLKNMNDLISKYDYFNTGQPTDYMIYYHWLRTFHETLCPIILNESKQENN